MEEGVGQGILEGPPLPRDPGSEKQWSCEVWGGEGGWSSLLSMRALSLSLDENDCSLSEMSRLQIASRKVMVVHYKHPAAASVRVLPAAIPSPT